MREIVIKNNHFIWGNLLDELGVDDWDKQDKIESIRLVVIQPSGETKEVVVKNNNQIWDDICREILGMDDYDITTKMDMMELTIDECECEAIKEGK